MEKMTVNFELKSAGADGVFAGYASVFGLVDSQGDIVQPGAFARSLREQAAPPALLWQHDLKQPIGAFGKVFEDARGLYVEGNVALTTRQGREAYSLLKKGVVNGLSIGFTPVRYRYDPEKNIRLLDEVMLWEVSLVTIPANASARVTVLKEAAVSLSYEATPDQLLRLYEALDRVENILR